MFFLNKQYGLLKTSLRKFCYGTIGITFLSEHAVLNDVFAKTHNLQRIYANWLKCIIICKIVENCFLFNFIVIRGEERKTLHDRSHSV